MTARTLLLGLMLGATCLAHAQTQQPLPRGPNVVTGRVLDMTSDAPVAGAVVTLSLPADAERISRPPTRNVMTTQDGYFVFRDLAAGKYTITTTAFGYYRNDFPSQAVQVQDTAKPVNVFVRVWRHGTISGRVIDERGAPVVGVPVTVLRRQVIGGRLALTKEVEDVTTDDRGAYRISELPPGRYVVGALASSISMPSALADAVDVANPTGGFMLPSRIPGGGVVRSGGGLRLGEYVFQRTGVPPALSPEGRLLVYPSTLFPGVGNPDDATVITLASGESRTDADIPLRFAPAMRISGVVVGPPDAVKHIGIKLVRPGSAETSSLDPPGLTSAVTDERGNFTFVGVPPGEHELRTAYMKFASERVASESLSAIQKVIVSDADVTGVALTLTAGVQIRGRVEYRAAPGTQPSASDRLLFILRPVEAESWSSAPGQMQPDRTFTILGSPPGKYEIYASSAAGWRNVDVTTGGRTAPDFILDLVDRDLTDVVVTVSNGSRRVSGTVSDPKGVADPDVEVFAFPADTTIWREGIFQSRRVQRVRTSSTGEFEMPALAPGEYYLTAMNVRFTIDWEDPEFLERLIAGAIKVTLADGDDKKVALTTFTPKVR